MHWLIPKLLSSFLLLPFYLLILFGIGIALLPHRPRLGRNLIIIAWLALWALSTPVISVSLLQSLENTQRCALRRDVLRRARLRPRHRKLIRPSTAPSCGGTPSPHGKTDPCHWGKTLQSYPRSHSDEGNTRTRFSRPCALAGRTVARHDGKRALQRRRSQGPGSAPCSLSDPCRAYSSCAGRVSEGRL